MTHAPTPHDRTTRIVRHKAGLRSGWLVVPFILMPAVAWSADPTAITTTASTGSSAVVLSPAYAIQLATSDDLPRLDTLPDLALLRRHRLYILKAERGKSFAYRLRLGFFTDIKQAQNAKAEIDKHFPGSWILKVSSQEQRESLELALVAGESQPAPAPAITAAVPPVEPNTASAERPPAPVENRLASLMEGGRQAVAQGNYSLAIRIYTKVLETGDSEYAKDALEYLGLARERNGQEAHAKAEYEKYLDLYPKDPGAERVRQRLAGLLTARETPREKLPEQKSATGKPMAWSGAGSFSQYYRRDAISVDGTGETVTQSGLNSDLDLSTRGRSENYDVRARFNGGYTYDFLSDGDNLSRISSLYVDASHRRAGLSGRLGRQTRSTGGVFGRFDGLLVSYQTGSLGKFNIVGGYPVERSTDTSLNHDKVFYGLSTDLPAWIEHWDYSIYAITQQVGDLTDRSAIGGEARYLDETRSLLALLDYDTLFQSVNIFSLLGNWTFDERTAYNFAYNQSRSPFLSTYNALIGQTVLRVEDLQDSYSKDEIQELALDRTSTSRALSGGITRTLNDKLQLNADITIYSLSSTPASGDVDATEGTGNEFLYALQLVGNSIIRQGDLAILGMVYSDASTTNTTTLNLNTRYPVSDVLRINPRLRLDYRQFEQGDGTQWITTPSIRFDYHYRRNLDLDADIGSQWSNRDTSTTTERTSGYYIYIGYNLGF
jgi:hypothetical protein